MVTVYDRLTDVTPNFGYKFSYIQKLRYKSLDIIYLHTNVTM